MSVAVGFFGKIPSRGDFVRRGLPPTFIKACDAWWMQMIPASQRCLGDGWVDAWMQAPIWRFAFAPGCCGPAPALGLWVPSTDRSGRLFPLIAAAVAPSWQDLSGLANFLAAAEEIAIGAVAADIQPSDLAASLLRAALPGGSPIDPPTGTTWWTDGSPLVEPTTLHLPAMPDAITFITMLR